MADANNVDTLKRRLQAKIGFFKNNANHKKSPAGIGYLRSRLETSVKLYDKYRV